MNLSNHTNYNRDDVKKCEQKLFLSLSLLQNDLPPPYYSVAVDPQTPPMTYEEVIYQDKYGVAQKTVPYYVQKDPAQVRVSAVIVTQRVVGKY